VYFDLEQLEIWVLIEVFFVILRVFDVTLGLD